MSDHVQDAATAAATEPTKDWRLEYLREAGHARRYRQRAQRAESELTEVRTQALTAEQYEEYQKLKCLKDEAAQKDAEVASLKDTIRRVVGQAALNEALAACGVGRAGGERTLAHAAKLLADRIRVDLAEGGPVVHVLGDAGRPMTAGDDDRPVTVREFVGQWLAEEGAHFLPASGDTGSGAHKGAASAGVSIRDLDADPRRKARFIATYGPQAYVQLARRKGS